MRMNVVPEPRMPKKPYKWEMVAFRPIAPGEELFGMAGHQYWLQPIMRRHPNPLVRLLLYRFLTASNPEIFLQVSQSVSSTTTP